MVKIKMGFLTQLKHGWNAFTNRDPTPVNYYTGPSSWYRPDKVSFSRGNDRTIVGAIFTRIALDVAGIEIEHVKLDDQGRYSETMNSGLNNCLTLEANIDQNARDFIQDVVESMCDEGVVAVVPVDTDLNPYVTGSYDIKTLRTGKIISWKPKSVIVNLYDDNTGKFRDIEVPKKSTAIIPNPFYNIMNEPNSTLKRLVHKYDLLDSIDDQNASGKLNMIIQLPYTTRTEARQKDADRRRNEIEMQLVNSKYGIAYSDATEKIIQLNRSLENNLPEQIEKLTARLYSQLGITEEIMNGTADEKTMTNYYSRTIEPIVNAITLEFTRKFLTKTSRTQGHAVMYFNKPFSLVPTKDLAELADKFTRNEIMSSNEFRQVIGLKPSDDPKDDALLNKNIARDEYGEEYYQNGMDEADYQELTDTTGQIDNDLDELEEMMQSELMHYASPYYDPVKAHEYYMKTRQLKGRNTNRGTLNEQGQEAQQYLKYQIDQDKSRVNESIRLKQKQQQQKLQLDRTAAIRNATRNTQAEISALREQLKGMTPHQREKAKSFIEKRIEALRDANDQHKASIQSEYDMNASKLNGDIAQELATTKEEYAKRYEDELNKIYADSNMTKQKSSGSKSSGSKSTGSSKKGKKDYRIWYGYGDSRNYN